MQSKMIEMEIDYIKAQIEHLETKASIWAERLGPNDDIVKTLDREIRKLNEKLLDYAVVTQKLEVEKARIY